MARNLATIVLLLVDLIRNDPQEAQQLYTTTRETLVDPKMSARTMPHTWLESWIGTVQDWNKPEPTLGCGREMGDDDVAS